MKTINSLQPGWSMLQLILIFFLFTQQLAAQMKVHFINVGQGSSCLIEFPCGVMLIDAGGEMNDDFNSNDALAAYLEDFFDRNPALNHTIKTLYITHPHIDHTRGVPNLLVKPYVIKNAVTNGMETGSGGPQQRKLHRAVQTSEDNADPKDDIKFEAVTTDEIGSGGFTNKVIDAFDCSGTNPVIKILWGTMPTNPGLPPKEFENPNNHSLVIRIEYGKSSLLFTGDLEDHAIEELLKKYGSSSLLDADVYVAGHHGSKNGTTEALLDKVTPRYAVISMGDVGREVMWTAWAYGHPNKGVMDMLESKVSQSRPSITVQAGDGAKKFVDYKVTKAVYATAWDDHVEFVADATGAWTVPGGSADATALALVDINKASVDELQTLPGIGVTKAKAIITYRKTKPFKKVEDLDNVPGIGPATFDLLKPLISVK